MTDQELSFIKYAVEAIQSGFVSKLEHGRILVYKCQKLIRIDVSEAK